MRPGVCALAGAIAVLAFIVGGASSKLISPPAIGQASACAGADLQSSQLSPGREEAALLCLINLRRSEAGATRVHENKRLRSAAALQAENMVHQGFFAHTCPGGSTFLDRIRRTGYMRRSSYWVVGENLAWGTASLSSPGALVRAWMESASHRRNLLDSRFREIGIAVHPGSPYDPTAAGVTVATEYGRRRPHHIPRAGAAIALDSAQCRRTAS